MSGQQNYDQIKNLFNQKFDQVCRDSKSKCFGGLMNKGWNQLKMELQNVFANFVEDFRNTLQASPNLSNLIKQDPPAHDKRDIFISYNWGPRPQNIHKKKALNLCDILKRNNYTVWLDQNDFGRHPTVATDLTYGIENSSLFICLPTNEYCLSANCLAEFNWAMNHRKPILPILLEPIDKLNRDIRFYVSQLSYFESRKSNVPLNDDWSNLENSQFLSQILSRIQGHLGQNQTSLGLSPLSSSNLK